MLRLIIRLLCLSVLFAVVVSAQTRDVRPSQVAINERARQVEPFIDAAARRYGVDANLLRAVCFIESRFRVDALSPKGARGPMQFMPDTARRYGLVNPYDPQQAIDAAARYLKDLLKRFGGRVDLALAAYNSGEGTVNSFLTGHPLVLPSGKLINPHRLITGGVPPYTETQNYVRQGLSLLRQVVSTKKVLPTQLGISGSTTSSPPRDFTVDTVNVDIPIINKSRPRIDSFIDVR